MIRRRILYGGALAAAVLYQILYEGYLGTLFLVLVIAMPLLALALSLPGLLGSTLVLAARVPAVSRGEAAEFQIRLVCRWPLPAARVTLRLELTNQLTGGTRTIRRVLQGPGRDTALRESAAPGRCGQITCRAVRPRICDLSGLFAFPLRTAGEAAVLVLPLPDGAELPPELLGGRQDGVQLKPRPGGGPGEDYDLRPYRPGDPLRAVHWKLSSKLDSLVVRETLEPCRAALALTYDHFGPPEALDRTLDRLYGLSLLLLKRGRSHRIQWADPVSGAVQDWPVNGEGELIAALAAALALRAPETGQSILDQPPPQAGDRGAIRRFHVAPEPGERGAAE